MSAASVENAVDSLLDGDYDIATAVGHDRRHRMCYFGDTLDVNGAVIR